MRNHLVLTVLCDDRSGIVDRLSDVISQHHGLWVESRMASLAGKFAGLLHVNAPAAQIAALTAALQALPGITVHVESAANVAVVDATTVSVELLAQDDVGIVHQLSGALMRLGVSVDALETEVEEAAMGGGVLFKARATLSMPPDGDLTALSQRLHAVADALAADIHIQADL